MVPVSIRGTYEMLPPGRNIAYPSKISLSFGKPVHPGDKDYDEIVRTLHQSCSIVPGKQLIKPVIGREIV